MSRQSPQSRRFVVAAVALLMATAVLAIVIPLPQPVVSDGERDPSGRVTVVSSGQEEDLDAFLDTERWGQSLRELQAAEAAAERGRLSAELEEMGYVGLIVTLDGSFILLRLPDGTITRLAVGDRTPDGRTLWELGKNTLTLRGGNGAEETLELFPRPAPNGGA